MKLTEQDYKDVAALLGVDVATIKAVTEVESSGSGFLPSGRPKILFEGHVFWSELKKVGLNPSVYLAPSILYPRWTKKHYKGGEAEWDRLERAQKIHDAAALKSASWGLFQIMGFNYSMCGFESLQDFVEAMMESEGEHLKAFCRYVKAVHLDNALRDHSWTLFAKAYNGPGYAKNRYDEKLRTAYEKYAKEE